MEARAVVLASEARLLDLRQHLPVTPRQRDVLSGLVEGRSLLEVAEQLSLSLDTVRMHVRRLHARVGSRNLHGLCMWASAHGRCCGALIDGQELAGRDPEYVRSGVAGSGQRRVPSGRSEP